MKKAKRGEGIKEDRMGAGDEKGGEDREGGIGRFLPSQILGKLVPKKLYPIIMPRHVTWKSFVRLLSLGPKL